VISFPPCAPVGGKRSSGKPTLEPAEWLAEHGGTTKVFSYDKEIGGHIAANVKPDPKLHFQRGALPLPEPPL
jgi:hypothetical protein